MAAAIGLIGVVLGAMLAPVVDWVWQSQQIQAAGGWDGAQIGAAYDLWKQAEQDLIDAARAQLGAS
jgi:hypothetical protein